MAAKTSLKSFPHNAINTAECFFLQGVFLAHYTWLKHACAFILFKLTGEGWRRGGGA